MLEKLSQMGTRLACVIAGAKQMSLQFLAEGDERRCAERKWRRPSTAAVRCRYVGAVPCLPRAALSCGFSGLVHEETHSCASYFI